MNKSKVFCFEGEWHRQHQSVSVKPLLELLKSIDAWNRDETSINRSNVEFFYKPCQSIGRLREELDALDGRKLRSSASNVCIYFAFHGSGSGLHQGGDEISFLDIADALGEKANDKIIFFSSCGGRGTEIQLNDVKQITGAKYVIGYGANADWLTASLFELYFFNELIALNKKADGHLMRKIKLQSDQKMFKSLKVIVA